MSSNLTPSAIFAVLMSAIPFSPVILALVDRAMPADVAGVDRNVLRSVAFDLVSRKIMAMSMPMMAAVIILAGCFEYSAWIRCRTVFSKADPAQQHDHMIWAQALPLVPLREFVRLVRSFTLMAVYDHPSTRSAIGFQPGGYVSV